MTKERLRRQDPSRSEPIREWGQLFRQAEPEGAAEAANAGADNGATSPQLDDVVSHAVNLGYKIVEEHIDQGERVAEQISDGSSSASASAGGDATEFIQRLLRFYADVGLICFEFIESLSRSAVVKDGMRGFMDDGVAAPAGQAAQDPGHRNIPVDMVSEAPARVALDLTAPVNGCALGVHALFALDQSRPPLQDVGFHNDTPGSDTTLRIRIPPGQPAGTYTGAVIDAATNQPRGTLTVQIRARESEQR